MPSIDTSPGYLYILHLCVKLYVVRINNRAYQYSKLSENRQATDQGVGYWEKTAEALTDSPRKVCNNQVSLTDNLFRNWTHNFLESY